MRVSNLHDGVRTSFGAVCHAAPLELEKRKKTGGGDQKKSFDEVQRLKIIEILRQNGWCVEYSTTVRPLPGGKIYISGLNTNADYSDAKVDTVKSNIEKETGILKENIVIGKGRSQVEKDEESDSQRAFKIKDKIHTDVLEKRDWYISGTTTISGVTSSGIRITHLKSDATTPYSSDELTSARAEIATITGLPISKVVIMPPLNPKKRKGFSYLLTGGGKKGRLSVIRSTTKEILIENKLWKNSTDSHIFIDEESEETMVTVIGINNNTDRIKVAEQTLREKLGVKLIVHDVKKDGPLPKNTACKVAEIILRQERVFSRSTTSFDWGCDDKTREEFLQITGVKTTSDDAFGKLKSRIKKEIGWNIEIALQEVTQDLLTVFAGQVQNMLKDWKNSRAYIVEKNIISAVSSDKEDTENISAVDRRYSTLSLTIPSVFILIDDKDLRQHENEFPHYLITEMKRLVHFDVKPHIKSRLCEKELQALLVGLGIPLHEVKITRIELEEIEAGEEATHRVVPRMNVTLGTTNPQVEKKLAGTTELIENKTPLIHFRELIRENTGLSLDDISVSVNRFEPGTLATPKKVIIKSLKPQDPEYHGMFSLVKPFKVAAEISAGAIRIKYIEALNPNGLFVNSPELASLWQTSVINVDKHKGYKSLEEPEYLKQSLARLRQAFALGGAGGVKIEVKDSCVPNQIIISIPRTLDLPPVISFMERIASLLITHLATHESIKPAYEVVIGSNLTRSRSDETRFQTLSTISTATKKASEVKAECINYLSQNRPRKSNEALDKVYEDLIREFESTCIRICVTSPYITIIFPQEVPNIIITPLLEHLSKTIAAAGYTINHLISTPKKETQVPDDKKTKPDDDSLTRLKERLAKRARELELDAVADSVEAEE